MLYSPTDHKGYALPLVLAISLIIIVITMGISNSIHRKTLTAIDLNDYSAAQVASYSAMNEVIYNILTSTFTPYGMDVREQGVVKRNWNLWGNPVVLNDNTTIRLQDMSGMVSPLFFSKNLKLYLEYYSEDSEKFIRFQDALSDWQDRDNLKRINGAETFEYKAAGLDYVPRNFYIQLIDEIRLLLNYDSEIIDKSGEDIAYWGSSSVNYLTMSEKTLRALLRDDDVVNTLLEMRNEGELNSQLFRSLTHIPLTEDINNFPGGFIKISVLSTVGNSSGRIEAIIKKRQNSSAPFRILEWRR